MDRCGVPGHVFWLIVLVIVKKNYHYGDKLVVNG
jgi:hypothetical protein